MRHESCRRASPGGIEPEGELENNTHGTEYDKKMKLVQCNDLETGSGVRYSNLWRPISSDLEEDRHGWCAIRGLTTAKVDGNMYQNGYGVFYKLAR